MAIVEDLPESSAYTSARDIPLRHPSDTPPSTEPLLRSVTPPGTSTRRRTAPGASEAAATPAATTAVVDEDEDGGLTEEIFDTIMMTVPFTFLFVLLHILVHMQYSHRPTWDSVLNGLLTAIPTLGISLFYANRYASHTLTRGALMAASILSGARLIWLVNKASWSVVTAQAPAMGTIWILTIVQLPLLNGLLCLAGVGGYVWYTGLNIYP